MFLRTYYRYHVLRTTTIYYFLQCQVLQQRAVVIPAKAHFLLDRAADHQPNGYATNKTASFFFQGRFVFRGGSSSASSKKKYKRDSSSGSSSSSVTSEGNSREAAFKHFHKLFTDAQGALPCRIYSTFILCLSNHSSSRCVCVNKSNVTSSFPALQCTTSTLTVKSAAVLLGSMPSNERLEQRCRVI